MADDDIPDYVIEWDGHLTTGGERVLGSPRSIAHLEFTAHRARQRGVTLRVIQSAWHKGVPASKHTHDFDAVYDFFVDGLGWDQAQTFLRRWGWACWHRRPDQGDWNDHVHGISLGYDKPVGKYIPSQVTDYKNGALGLSGLHEPGNDATWRPDPQFVFDYDAWLKDGNDMQFEDLIPGTHQKEVGEALATIFANDRRTQRIVRGIHRAVDGVREMREEIESNAALDAEVQAKLVAKLDRVRDRLLDAVSDDQDDDV
jgi:hypothetical protein